MQVRWNRNGKFVSVSQLLGLALCCISGSVSVHFITPGLIVSHMGEKRRGEPPVDFKPTKRVLVVFLDATGRGKMVFAFLPSCSFVRMGSSSGLQYSQLPSLQLRSSMHCQAPIIHLHQAGVFNPPVCCP